MGWKAAQTTATMIISVLPQICPRDISSVPWVSGRSSVGPASSVPIGGLLQVVLTLSFRCLQGPGQQRCATEDMQSWAVALSSTLPVARSDGEPPSQPEYESSHDKSM